MPKRLLKEPRHFLDATLGSYRWYRRLRGGHWERWHIASPINGEVWICVSICFWQSAKRPALAKGSPVCESHDRAAP